MTFIFLNVHFLCCFWNSLGFLEFSFFYQFLFSNNNYNKKMNKQAKKIKPLNAEKRGITSTTKENKTKMSKKKRKLNLIH